MKKSSQIRVLVVDDHRVVRSGLKAFFMSFDDMELVGEANDGQKAVAICQETQPDVVLMDIVMPNMDGIAAIGIIKKKWPHIEIVAFTSFDERDLINGALRAGAIGYILKNSPADELANAIRAAAKGSSVLSPEVTKVLVNGVRTLSGEAVKLTNREFEILELMIEGLTNIDIAKHLIISPATVKFHVSNILSKLDASSRTEAVASAIKSKLIK